MNTSFVPGTGMTKARRYMGFFMMTSSNGNIFRVTGHLCGEFTRHRCIPHTKASDAELWYFLFCARINAWVNTGEADLRRHRAHYDVIMCDDNAMYSTAFYLLCLRIQFVVNWHHLILPISFRVPSLALGQSYDWTSANERILKEMREYIAWITRNWQHNHN